MFTFKPKPQPPKEKEEWECGECHETVTPNGEHLCPSQTEEDKPTPRSMNKNKKTLDDFNTYCAEHPELRFWQALRNFADVAFIHFSGRPPEKWESDTFYFEGKNK